MVRAVVLRAFVALLSLARVASSASGRALPCPDGRFPLVGVPPLVEGGPLETVVIENGLVRIEDVCPAIAARVHASRLSTRVRARWHDCPGVTGPVRLWGRLAAPDCN